MTVSTTLPLLLLLLLFLPDAAQAQAQAHATRNARNAHSLAWAFAGPTTYVPAFRDPDHPPLAAAGAVQNIVRSSTGWWLLGSVNGGIWRAASLAVASPDWTPVLDGQDGIACTSMSALKASTVSPNTLYAGCGGSTSSEQGRDWNVVNSGEWGGIMVSKDDGDSWSMLPGFPPNYYVTDILDVSTHNHNNPTVLLVAAQSHLWDKRDGGIWKSIDGGHTFQRVSTLPTFNLYLRPSDDVDPLRAIVATHARNRHHAVSVSWNGGETFRPDGMGMAWAPKAIPFYTCYARLGNGMEVFAALTRLPGLGNHTDSQLFVRHGLREAWQAVSQPMAMDQDGMPKDRMAVLADPDVADLLYVAGNAGALAWRVNITNQTWTRLWGPKDVSDGSVPHGDCRNFAWDAQSERLLLVTDGGAFARTLPRQPGGRWVSLNGNYASLELLSAKYDPHGQRFVAGAQDNCAIVTKPGAQPSDAGWGFVFGDGTVTLVDASAGAVASGGSRLFGTTQFLGVGVVERDPDGKRRRRSKHRVQDDDDDEGCGGLCFVQGERFVEVPVADYFAEASSFPYFVHPYALNVQDPTKLIVWTNGTQARPSAFYRFDLPYTVMDRDDIGPPVKVQNSPRGEYVLDFVSGGYTAGLPDPDLLVAVTNTHLLVNSSVHGGGEHWRRLPVEFALPIGLDYDADGTRILGPLTHARTVHLAVSGSDSHFLAVTGWQRIDKNPTDESVFVTLDAGRTWRNVTGNLRAAAGVQGLLRPGGMVWIDLEEADGSGSKRALLVGTSTGVFGTVVAPHAVGGGGEQRWMRLGGQPQWMRLGPRTGGLPLVLVADVDHERISDTLVAATFGRGIYTVPNITNALAGLDACLGADAAPTQAYCGACRDKDDEGRDDEHCCCVAAAANDDNGPSLRIARDRA